MIKAQFPPPLNPGDRIQVISPAGPVDPKRLKKGVRILEEWGYRVQLSPHALSKSGFLAGSDEERLDDLSNALLNPEVSCIFCSRGGYGVLRLLHRLDWKAISTCSVKAIVGFSDISAFQIVLLERCGWGSYSGPQAAMSLSGDATERSLMHLRGMLDGSMRRLTFDGEDDIRLKPVCSGASQGILIPCNLAMLVSLIGTEFMPDLSGAILCIEDLSESPYRIDRMLWQLGSSGVIDNISSLVLGSFIWEGRTIIDDVCTSVLDLYRNFSFPVWRGLPYGHIDDRLTLPVGVEVVIEPDGRLIPTDAIIVFN